MGRFGGHDRNVLKLICDDGLPRSVESEVAQSCNPMDCSPPGSSVHGIFQARVLEWGAIAFSAYKYVCV